ncbi:MORN repeat-containing protein 4, partial [Operophtera brumata]
MGHLVLPDGTRYDGAMIGGLCSGLGVMAFADGANNGFPRNEGFFQDCRLVRRKRCPEVVQRAQKVAYMARAQCQQI